MDGKVICIELSRGDFSYAISMYDDVIVDLLCIPESVRVQEVVDLTLSNIPINPNDIICYDANGIGVAIRDAIANRFHYEEGLMPLDHVALKEVPLLLNEAKSKLLDYALNSDARYLNKGEFKRLYTEVHNLELKDVRGNVKLQQIDKNIGKTRASCYLNALYALSQR